MADANQPAVASGTQNRPRRNKRRGGPPRSQAAESQHESQPQTRNIASRRGRQFGGQLTRLHGDTPPFVPASVSSTTPASTKPNEKCPSPTVAPSTTSRTYRPRRLSKLRSTAPDIATRTHEDIDHGIYECAICTNEISRNSKVWSCHTCWTVFHIGCIKKWSKNEGSAVVRAGSGDENEIPGKQWRCPGCNLPKDVFPSSYTCWCEKEIDPKTIAGLPSHSCGQTCGKERTFPKACPHPCDLLCHAGPCPPCSSMGPMQSCFCGKQTSTRRCLDTDYEAGWSCGAICEDMMPCGEHTCQRPCHEGLCGACMAEIPARCYCGKVEKTMFCSNRGTEKESDGWIGMFDCQQECGRLMDCGFHKCEKVCHPQDHATPHCLRSPDIVKQCPCGKTPLADINAAERKSCRDPIPSCNEPCGKTLRCGHTCPQICHTGECLPCFLNVPIACRCGRNTFNSICHGGNVEPPHCMRVCKAVLNCGRHECGERCCTGERKAAERIATKKKLKPLGAVTRTLDDGVEAEHICTRVCGRKLKCGNHACAELCHKGPCGSCKEAIFDDIACSCGRTVLQAPLPCRTKPPPCSFPCNRPKDCGHPQVAHNCHADEAECPKCPFLTERKCLCGKKTLKNQPCWRADVLCGLVCRKRLKCGFHFCCKTCHRDGECEDAITHCQQECGKPKRTCDHPCEQPCHAPSACKEDKPCPFKLMITCDCQRKKEEVKCNARAGIPDPPGRQTSLKCDDECARLERNRNLAMALHISDDHTDDHVPYSTSTLNIYLEDVAWAHKHEEELRLFAADDTQKRYRFKPMKPRQRAFIHSMAEDFGFDGESLDPEPHRHVLLFKTPKFVSAPMKTLAQAARIRRAQLNIQAPINITSAPEKRADEAERHNYNGFVLRNPRFALTEEELRDALFQASPNLQFDIIFLATEDAIALVAQTQSNFQLPTTLIQLLPNLTASIIRPGLASTILLAELSNPTTSSQPQILHETTQTMLYNSKIASGGWSQVAAKKALPMQAPVVKPVGVKPVYTVLGSRLAEAKKRREDEKRREKEKEEVLDDWSLGVEDEGELDGEAAGVGDEVGKDEKGEL